MDSAKKSSPLTAKKVGAEPYWSQKQAIKWVDFSPPRFPREFARTSGGPQADPPGVILLQTQADLLRTPPESTVDPKIHGGFAVDSPQVRSGAIDFLVSKNPKKSASLPKESESVCRRLVFDFGGQESNCPQQIRCGFLARSKNPP